MLISCPQSWGWSTYYLLFYELTIIVPGCYGIVSKSAFLRPSQIACTFATVYVTCTQTALCVNENPCTVFIPCVKIIWIRQCVRLFFCPVFGWPVEKLIWLHKNIFYQALSVILSLPKFGIPARAMNCENCQLFLTTGVINLLQLRTTNCPSTQTIMP